MPSGENFYTSPHSPNCAQRHETTMRNTIISTNGTKTDKRGIRLNRKVVATLADILRATLGTARFLLHRLASPLTLAHAAVGVGRARPLVMGARPAPVHSESFRMWPVYRSGGPESESRVGRF